MSEFQVRVVGGGLHNGLGKTVKTAAQNMLSEAPAAAANLQLDELEPPLSMPYFSLSQNSQPRPGESSRFEDVLEPVLAEALAGRELDAECPVWIGSSSFDMGAMESDYLRRQAEGGVEDGVVFRQPHFSRIAEYLRQQYGHRGLYYSINTACTSSANAILNACRSIQQGLTDRALVIGLELYNRMSISGFAGMQLISASGVMRPFDQRRDGLILGEACSAILLERYRPGDSGMVLRGGAHCFDAHSISSSNPDGSEIARVMRKALDSARLTAKDIVAVKAHGTASPLNDDGEAAGLRVLFEGHSGTGVPPFMSLKGYAGHTLGACGSNELLLLKAALESGLLPASAGFEQADAALAVEPLAAPIAASAGHYLLNYFGFGGSNCVLAAEWRP